MKRTLITLAATAATCFGSQVAMAQSSVTISGFLDLGAGKSIGTDNKAIQESAPGNSRLTINGREDLGGGYSAFFSIEHRMRPDTGQEAVPNRFWFGHSLVGIRSPYGMLSLGRQYIPAFSLVQNQVDPFRGMSVANLRDFAMRPGASVLGFTSGPAGEPFTAKVRFTDSIRYDASFKGLNFSAAIAESEQEAGTQRGPDRPWSVAANYTSGPLFISLGYEDPQFEDDHQWSLGARYKIGAATLSAGYTDGRTRSDLKLKGALIGLTYNVGVGEFKAGYGQSKVGDGATAVERKRFGIGYNHNLSKRTTLYANVAHEREIDDNENGYDLGIIVRF